jgi:hypothetical protein
MCGTSELLVDIVLDPVLPSWFSAPAPFLGGPECAQYPGDIICNHLPHMHVLPSYIELKFKINLPGRLLVGLRYLCITGAN